jgi:hypothetical protein
LGVHPNFGGCNVPSNSSFGGTKKMNCIFSMQGRAFCILCHRHWIVPRVFGITCTPRWKNLWVCWTLPHVWQTLGMTPNIWKLTVW